MDEKEKQIRHRRLIGFTEPAEEMMQEIMQKDGAPSISAVVHTAVAFYHKKLFPVYGSMRLSGTKIAGMGDKAPSIEEIADKQERIKQARKDAAEKQLIEKQSKICKIDLYGEVKEEDGTTYCVWHQFSDTGSADQQRMRIDLINKNYAKYTFSPNKKRVMERQPELMKKHGIQ